MKSKKKNPAHRAWTVSGLALTGVLAIGAFFFAGQHLSAGTNASALAPDPDPNGVATPAPGEQPDFREPFWYHKWVVQDMARPRFDVTVSGIEVGPNVDRTGVPCDTNDTVAAAATRDIAGSAVHIELAYLPDGAEIVSSVAVTCRDRTLSSEVLVQLPTLEESEIARRLAEGESFYDLPHGAFFSIFRIVAGPAFESGIPAERWYATTIAGHPAAIAAPLIEAGFGDSEVIFHRDGVLPVIRAMDLSLAELIAVAEGVMQ